MYLSLGRLSRTVQSKAYISFNNQLTITGIFLLLSVIYTGAGVATAQKPELYVQTGHAGPIYSVAYSPDGKILASSSEDQTIKLWNVETRREILTLPGIGRIMSIAFSPDGKLLASSGDAGNLNVWDVRSGKKVWSYSQSMSIPAVVFSPNGKYVAAWSQDLIIWDASTGKEIRRLDGMGKYSAWMGLNNGQVFRPLEFSPDSTKIAALNEGRLKLFDVNSGKKIRGYSQYSFRAMAFSPDGKIMAVDEIKLLDEGEGNKVNIWDVAKEKLLGTLPGHSKTIGSIKFSPDGRFVATASHDKTIKLWDVATRTEIKTFSGHQDWVNSIAFSPDGKTLASASGSLYYSSNDNSIKFWNVSTGESLGGLVGQRGKNFSLAISADGKKMASFVTDTNQSVLSIWDLSIGQKLHTFKIPAWLLSVSISPDGNKFVTADRNGMATIWDINTGQKLDSFKCHDDTVFSAVFSPDGNKLAAGGAGDFGIRVWDLASKRQLQVLKGHKENILNLVFSPDGKYLVSGGLDKRVLIWDLGRGVQLTNLINISSLKIDEVPAQSSLLDKLGEGQLFGGSNVAFSPDGKMLAIGVGGYGIARVGNEDKVVKIQNEVRVYNFAGKEEIYKLTGHRATVQSISFSSDNQFLVSGSADGTIIQWDMKTGQKKNTFTKNLDTDTFGAFIPHSDLIVGVSRGITNLWDAKTGDLLVTLTSLEETREWLAVTPDGLFDGSPVAWQKLLWRFSQSGNEIMPVESFFSDFFYPNLLAEIYAGRRPKAKAQIESKDRRQPQLTILPIDSSSSRTVKVKVEVSEAPSDQLHPNGGGVRDVRLFRNGSLVKAWRGEIISAGQGKKILETDVTLIAGKNDLTAYAFNLDNIKSPDASLKITGSENFRRQGRAYILAIGVNVYSNPQFNLKYAVPDAKIFGSELQQQQSRLNTFERVQVISLFDNQAKKENIQRAFKLFAGEEDGKQTIPPELSKIERLQPEDSLTVYFAGHGFASNDKFFLVPNDLGYAGQRSNLSETGLETILSHSISDRDLETALEKIDAGQMLLVIDACNSGQALESEEKRRGPMNSRGLAQLAYEKGISILTASQSYQAALETAQLGHGYLTYALVVEGLSQFSADGTPGDGQIESREWFDYAVERVPRMQQAQSQRLQSATPVAAAKVRAGKKRQLEKAASKETVPVVRQAERYQTPRVFYRREIGVLPMVIARH